MLTLKAALVMSQPTFTNIDKAAVLLTRLEPQALDKVLLLLGPEFAGKLRPMLSAVSRRKDLGALTEQVLQEFRELQQDVQAAVSGSVILQQTLQSSQTAAAQPNSAGQSSQAGAASQAGDGSTQATEVTDNADSNVSAIEALAKFPPAILAAALKQESPRLIATVLKQLPTEVSGKVLEVLPAENRQGVFLLMADTVQIHPTVVDRLLQQLIGCCGAVDPAVAEQTDRRVKTLIGVLQTVEREERLRLMESLTERDPDLAAQIDDSMYDYTDVLRIEDRSVQKLLGQLEQKVVAMALKSAAEDLRQKVLKNLSERVRLALNEEMELLTSVTAAKADQARKEIANVIRSQDKEGTLVWIE